jgi:hypothetical protein
MNKCGVKMENVQIKLPLRVKLAAIDYCKKETKRRGEFYSLSRFVRECVLNVLRMPEK